MRRFVAKTLLGPTLVSLAKSTSSASNFVPIKPCVHAASFSVGFSKVVKVQDVSPSFIGFTKFTTSSSLGGNLVVPEDRLQPIKLLNASYDAFGGVVVDIKDPMDTNVFASLLRDSISQWRQQGKKGVWIKLPIKRANLVEAAIKEGFWYHHAEPTYLMLLYWIPKTPPTLPANASHRVGIGAFVANTNGEVLVVQEKYGRFKGKGFWKLPTGAVDEGEDICRAAVREVKEEAGIDAEFVEVVAFRQGHKSFFNKSDLFFVCKLRPLSFDIQKQNSEIEDAKWMPLEEYAAQPFVQKHEQFNYIAKMCLAKGNNNDDYTGFSVLPTTTNGFSGKKSCLYVNNKGFKE